MDPEDMDPEPKELEKRFGNFPGMAVKMSVGALSDLFEEQLELRVYDAVGFEIGYAGRIDGTSEAVEWVENAFEVQDRDVWILANSYFLGDVRT